MAGVLNRLLSIAGFYEEPEYPQDNGYEEDSYYDESGYTEEVDNTGGTLNEKFRNQSGGRVSGGNFGGSNATSSKSSSNTTGNLGNSGGTGNTGGTGSASNIINFSPQRPQNYVLVSAKPDRLEDAQLVCNHLKDRHVVIVNVEGIEAREAQRIVDFISGAVYALDGEIFDITNRIFAVAPSYVELQSIQRDPKTRGFMSFSNSGSSGR